MFELYDLVIEPILRAADAARVVEIGALRGDTTELLLGLLPADGELHVIDPEPQFDPDEHEARFEGRYQFHRAPSLEVLPDLGAFDAALIDGDHNWYTVFHELRALAAAARRADRPLPVLLLHDVGWPYGRRDLYYEPSRIPDELRHPFERLGMAPGHSELRRRGGFNPGHNNASEEGGPRNGVLTAVDDFLAEHDVAARCVVIPSFFGLAVVVDEERLAASPKLRTAIDQLDSRAGYLEAARLAEELRVRHLTTHATFVSSASEREQRLARRYLETVKTALLDEHHLENEVRIHYLADCVADGIRADQSKLSDPHHALRKELDALRAERATGLPAKLLTDEAALPYTTIGRRGLDHLEGCLDTIRAERIDGDLASCGVHRGGAAIFLRAHLAAYEEQHRTVWLADAFVEQYPAARKGELLAVAHLNHAREGLRRFDLFDERVRFLQGPAAAVLPDAPISRLALLHVGTIDLDETRDVLDALFDRVAPGGFVVFSHADAPGCRAAVEEFRARRGITDRLERVDDATSCWRVMATEDASESAPTATRETDAGRGAPLAPIRTQTIDLTVVVVFYNMRREAMRTLHSLSRSYQRELDDLDYEVIVVENGSDPGERLGTELVESFGPEFRYIDLGADAKPSPAHALNRGIAESRGSALALMIDGAHVLTPRVLHFGLLALRTHEPAIATTHQWYLGPGQQGDTMLHGYDQAYEDRLFDEIHWPADGYRLFEIGHFIGDRDWFDGMWESNCIFTPRAIVEQVGGFDETFSMAGGGYANLDFFERVGANPAVTVVNILGEGSFHQLHGGTTTNQPDIGERHDRLMTYREHYEAVRGHSFRGPGKTWHFVGSMIESARRTRARRLSSPHFAAAHNAQPREPAPIPDDLRSGFVDAYYRSEVWRETRWLGKRVQRAPTDLFAYQELLSKVRPDWVVMTRTGDGNRCFYMATLCELLGRGRVLSVQPENRKNLPKHPRLEYLVGEPTDPSVIRKVNARVGSGRAMLLLGSRRRSLVLREFEAYASLVPVGSYVVVEETVLNGHPSDPEHGPGPFEAVTVIMKLRRDFVPDPDYEKHGLTLNPRGFLKRVE